MTKTQDGKADRKGAPDQHLVRQRPIRPRVQNQKAGRGNQHRGSVIEIDRANVIALFRFKGQGALRTMLKERKGMCKQAALSAAWALKAKTATEDGQEAAKHKGSFTALLA